MWLHYILQLSQSVQVVFVVSLCDSLLPPQFIQDAGFRGVRAEDRTAQFIQVIQTELERAVAIREEYITVGQARQTYLYL